MNLVIDASNIQAGGGLTHLKELLACATPGYFGFKRVYLFAPTKVLTSVTNREWLEKLEHPYLNKGYFHKWLWRRNVLNPFLHKTGALLFIPGSGSSRYSYVTMCRNLLPLDSREMNRYFFSSTWVRLVILRHLHIRAYQSAKGVIFLNQYCVDALHRTAQVRIVEKCIIPHGLNPRFSKPISEEEVSAFSKDRPMNLLYVSIIDVYKHQWQVAEAVYQLVTEGYHLNLDIVGPAYRPAFRKLQETISRYSGSECVSYHGEIAYEQLERFYKRADAFVFASTCETYGMVLTEAMAAGLPIICSKYSSMPETVKDAGFYFDPLDVVSVKEAIAHLYMDAALREMMRKRAIEISSELSWSRCADDTFRFLADIARRTCVA